VWTALWLVYVLWGSTYLAIAYVVDTVPPLVGMGCASAPPPRCSPRTSPSAAGRARCG
jgi:hypothetical protein